MTASEGGTNDESKGCGCAAGRSARYAHRPALQRGAGDLRRAQYPARRHVRALLKDQEFPLACLRPPLPRLSSPPRRAGRADFRGHRRHRRARPQDRRHYAALDRPHRPLAASLGQRRRLRHAVGYACGATRRQQAAGRELARGPRDLREARRPGQRQLDRELDRRGRASHLVPVRGDPRSKRVSVFACRNEARQQTDKLMKIGIIGTGNVGCAGAMAAVNRGSAREVLLVNRTRKTAEAVATDMRYGTPLGPKVDIVDGDYDALEGAGIVLITVGVNEKTGGATDRNDPLGRLKLLDKNAEIYRDIVPRIVRAEPNAVLLVVSDPPDRPAGV